jgi:hypothetical protein
VPWLFALLLKDALSSFVDSKEVPASGISSAHLPLSRISRTMFGSAQTLKSGTENKKAAIQAAFLSDTRRSYLKLITPK